MSTRNATFDAVEDFVFKLDAEWAQEPPTGVIMNPFGATFALVRDFASKIDAEIAKRKSEFGKRLEVEFAERSATENAKREAEFAERLAAEDAKRDTLEEENKRLICQIQNQTLGNRAPRNRKPRQTSRTYESMKNEFEMREHLVKLNYVFGIEEELVPEMRYFFIIHCEADLSSVGRFMLGIFVRTALAAELVGKRNWEQLKEINESIQSHFADASEEELKLVLGWLLFPEDRHFKFNLTI